MVGLMLLRRMPGSMAMSDGWRISRIRMASWHSRTFQPLQSTSLACFTVHIPPRSSSDDSLEIGAPLFRKEFHPRRCINDNWFRVIVFRYSAIIHLRGVKTRCSGFCPKSQNNGPGMERPSQHDRSLDDWSPPPKLVLI